MKRIGLLSVCVCAFLLTCVVSPSATASAAAVNRVTTLSAITTHGAMFAPARAGEVLSADSGHGQKDRGPKGRGKGNGGRGAARFDDGPKGRAVERHAWSDRDHCHVVITQYYDRRGLPPGLAKKRSLPPGLRKQLHERGHLPPGLERYWVPLPVELERGLPPLPPHYVRRWVDDDLIVVDVRTNFVVSVMAGVFIRF